MSTIQEMIEKAASLKPGISAANEKHFSTSVRAGFGRLHKTGSPVVSIKTRRS